MTPTISELWHGNLEPVCHSGKNNKDIKDSFRLKNRNLEKIQEVLNDSQKELLERYSESIDELMDLLMEQAFCDGYCIGTKLIAEALTGAENLI